MNNVSIRSLFFKTLFWLSFFTVVSILFLFVSSLKAISLVLLVILIPQTFFIIIQLNIADVEFNENKGQITFIYLFKIKTFMYNMLNLYEIHIGRDLTFKMETNAGDICIHYTRTNYNILLNYLSFINYPDINHFIKKVKMRFSQPI